MATKFGRMINYLDGFLPLKSYDLLITWSCEITWQTKTIISPLPQCGHQTFYEVTYLQRLLTIKAFNALVLQRQVANENCYIFTNRVPMVIKLTLMVSYRNLWWQGLVKSRDKLNPWYLQQHSAYGHQTWQWGDLP